MNKLSQCGESRSSDCGLHPVMVSVRDDGQREEENQASQEQGSQWRRFYRKLRVKSHLFLMKNRTEKVWLNLAGKR